MQVLNSLEEKGILPVHINIIPATTAQEALVLGYEPQEFPNLPSLHMDVKDVFQLVIVVDIDGNSTPSVMRAAAMEHIKKKGVCYIQVPHGSRSIGDFNNPALLPMIFPTLFPYGLGGCED